MRMLLRLMLGLGLGLCAIALFQVVLAEPQLDMQLSVQRDAFCDGRVQTQADKKADKTVAPDECILYRLELVNIGTEAAQQLNITTLIPEHTTLHHIARPSDASYKTQAVQQANQASLRTYVERLEPGAEQAISLRYTVKVN